MNRVLAVCAALALTPVVMAKDPPPLPVVKQILAPTPAQGLVVLAFVANDRVVQDGLVVETVEPGPDGTRAQVTLFHESALPRATASRIMGAALPPGVWRVVGWAGIRNIGSRTQPKMVVLPWPVVFLEPTMAEFEVRAGQVTDLGLVYEHIHKGDLSLFMRSGAPARDQPYTASSEALTIARANIAPVLGWRAPVSAEERAMLDSERNAVASLVRLREADDGSWWTAGAYGRVFHRAPSGDWSSLRVPGDPRVTLVEPVGGGGVVVGGNYGAVAVLRDGRMVALPVAGLTNWPILGVACSQSLNCVVGQVLEETVPKPKGRGEIVVHHIVISRWAGAGDWTSILKFPIESTSQALFGRVDIDNLGERLLVRDIEEKKQHLVDAATGAVTTTAIETNGVVDASGDRLALDFSFSDDLGVTWTKLSATTDLPIMFGAGKRVVARDFDIQGYASNRVETMRVSADSGVSWGDERVMPTGYTSVGRRSNLIAVMQWPGGWDLFPGMGLFMESGFQPPPRPTLSTPSIIHWTADDGATWVIDRAIYSVRDIEGATP